MWADRPGFLSVFRSFEFGAECLGQHAGTHQVLDLGDGNGPSTCRILCNPAPFDLILGFRERNGSDSIRLRRPVSGDVSRNHPRREPFQVLGAEWTVTEQQRGVHGHLVRVTAYECVFPWIYRFRSGCEVYADDVVVLPCVYILSANHLVAFNGYNLGR